MCDREEYVAQFPGPKCYPPKPLETEPEIWKAVGAIYVIYSELLFDMDINWIADLFHVLKTFGTHLAFFSTPVFIWVYFEPNFFLYVSKRSIERVVKLGYRKSSIKSPRGILYFKRI